MQVFTYCGQRGAAVQQVKTRAQILANQLETEPDAITTQLYEQIRNGSSALPDEIPPALSALPRKLEIESAPLATVPLLKSEPFESFCAADCSLRLEDAIAKIPSN